jgi:hypothetical protein
MILIVEYLQMVFYALFDMKIVNSFDSGNSSAHLRMLSTSAADSSSSEVEAEVIDTRNYLTWDS